MADLNNLGVLACDVGPPRRMTQECQPSLNSTLSTSLGIRPGMPSIAKGNPHTAA